MLKREHKHVHFGKNRVSCRTAKAFAINSPDLNMFQREKPILPRYTPWIRAEQTTSQESSLGKAALANAFDTDHYPVRNSSTDNNVSRDGKTTRLSIDLSLEKKNHFESRHLSRLRLIYLRTSNIFYMYGTRVLPTFHSFFEGESIILVESRRHIIISSLATDVDKMYLWTIVVE